MLRINKLTLDMEVVQGDTASFSFRPKLNGEPILTEGDTIYFTLKKLPTNEVIIQKTITEFNDGIATVPLSPEETWELEEDNYAYDLKMKRADGNVDTLIPGKPYAYFCVKRGVKDEQ